MSTGVSSPARTPKTAESGDALSWNFAALTTERIAAIRPEWDDLASDLSENNIFAFPQFVLSALPLIAEKEPQLLELRMGGELTALLILRSDWGYGKLPVAFLRTAIHHEQFLGTPLVRKGREDDFARGLLAWIDQAPMQFALLNLAMITADGDIAAALSRRCAAEGRGLLPANAFERAATRPGEEGAEPQLSASRRKSLRKARKNLDKLGEVLVERLEPSGDLESWLSAFLAMENTGWKREEGSAILCCENETQLYQTITRDAFAKGNLNFSRLCVDGKPIAYTLDITAAPLGYCLKSAIDQDYRKYSPGVLMELETLEYYRGQSDCTLLDSCTAPDNTMLNELWPDRKAICDLVIARKGAIYATIFKAVRMLKGLTPADGAASGGGAQP